MMLSQLKRLFHVFLLVAVCAGFGLAGCSEIKKTNENIKADEAAAVDTLKQLEPKAPLAQPLVVDKRPYFGSRAVPITNGTPLPPQYEQSGAVVMTFARPVSLPELTRMIQAVTGLRAVAPSAALNSSSSSGGSEEGATEEGGSTSSSGFLPSDGERVAGGRVVWQGKLSDLLNQAADVFEADWSYNGGTIQFAQQITRTFMLNALASELSVTGSVQSGAGEEGGNLPEVSVSNTSSMKVWEEIKEAVNTITGDGGKAAFSPSTGTITVSGSPEIVRRVEAYLNQQNAMRLRRVAVALKVLSVTANDTLDLSMDLTGIVETAFDTASLRSVGEATAGVTIGVLKAPNNPTDVTDIEEDRISSALKADKRVKNVSVVHSGALVTLSDQPAPLQVGRQISYLKRTSSSSGDTGGSVTLEPGTVNTGLMMTILPRIVEQNKILMRLSVAITSAEQPFAEFGAGEGTASEILIQLPEIETTGFLQNAVVTSGETMVLAGFEKKGNSTTDDGAPDSAWLLGGSKSSSRTREITVLILTAEILPEDPITVIGN